MGVVGKAYALITADTTSFTRKMKGLGVTAGKLGRTLSMKLTAPLLLVGGAAVKVAADFEQKLTNAFSVTGSSSDEVKGKMEDLARTMGKSTVFSAGEAADAMYYMACLPPDELIITGDYQAKQIGSYKGNSVIGKNGEPQAVLKHTHRPCTEKEVLKIKPKLQRPFKVTANHPIYAIKGKPCLPYQKAGKSTSPCLCKPTCDNKKRESCTKEYYKDYEPEWVKAGDLTQNDILLIPRIKTEKDISIDWTEFGINRDFMYSRYKKKLPAEVDDDFAYFLGLMLGDGWADKERIGCVFNAEKDIESLNWFTNYLERLGYSFTKRNTPGAVQVAVWSRPLARIINAWNGRGAENKKIPAVLFKAKKNIVSSFLRGYIDSDGYVDFDTGMIGLSSISSNIGYTINYLAAKIGVVFSIGKSKAKKNVHMPSGAISDTKAFYTISTTNPEYIEKIFGIKPDKELLYQKHWVDKDYIYLPVSSIKKEKYEGFVYNFETEDNTYSTGIIVHNSAGWKAEEMTVALEDTLNLAAATQEDLAFTTNTVVSALNMFEMAASQAGEVADIYANAISNSQATMQKLGNSMSYVGPIANSLDIDLKDTTAALMGLYNKGIDASMAGTGLRMSLMKLLKPSGNAKKAIKGMGLTMEDVSPQTNDLVDVVGKLEEANMSAKDAVMIFGARASAAMINLVSTGKKGLTELRGNLDKTGAASEMAEKQIDTLKGQWKLLTSALSEVAIQFGKILIPLLKDLINKYIKPFVQWLGGLSEGWKKVIVTVGGFAAAAGPAMIIFSKLAKILPFIIGKMGGLTAKVVGLKGVMGKLGSVAMAAFAGWQIGRLIGELTGLDKVVENLVAKIFKLDTSLENLKKEQKEWQKEARKSGERLAAMQEASKLAGKEITNLKKAYEILDKAGSDTAKTIEKYIDVTELQTKAEQKELETTREAKKEQKKNKKSLEELLSAKEQATRAAEELRLEQEAATKAAAEWNARLDELGIKTIPQKAKAIQDLNDDLDKLERIYKAGEISLLQYKKAVEQVKAEIDALAEKAITETAIPAFRNMSGVLDNAVGEMEDRVPDITKKVEEETEKTESLWDKMADGLQTKWASTIGDVLSGATSMKEGLKGIWDAMKQQFFDIIGQMLAKWATDFVGGIISGAMEGGQSIIENVGDVLSDIGGTVKELGGSAASILSGGLSDVISGAISGLVSGLVSGGTDMDATNRELHNIWEEARNTLNIMKNVGPNIDILKKTAWKRNNLLGKLINVQSNQNKILKWQVAPRIKDVLTVLKQIGGFASGGIAWKPQLAMVGEREPEVIMPKREFDKNMQQDMSMMIDIQPVVIPRGDEYVIKFLQKSIRRGNFKIPISAVGK